MERGSRILVFLALFAALYFFFGRSEESAPTSKIKTFEPTVPEGQRPPPQLCDLWAEAYRAQVSTRGGVIVSHEPLTAKYKKTGEPMQLVTTPDHAQLSPLYTAFRGYAGQERSWLVETDIQDYELTRSSATECELTFETEQVKVVKTFSVGETPYVLDLDLRVTNKAGQPKDYQLSTVTAAYLLDSEVDSKMFRMNPRMSHVECLMKDDSVIRERLDDFDDDEFDDEARFPKNSINRGDWSQPAGTAHIAAVSNAYFTGAIAHEDGPSAPSCLLQIDRRYHRDQYASPKDDPNSGAIYQARLAYEPRQLAPGKTDEYRFRSFIGPKERKALAKSGAQFEELIDLGFFSVIAKVLVGYLLWLYDIIPSWGIAIVLLTITARMLLFPLTWPSVKNMIQMRELKPEMDRLNEKFKDDPQAKGLAQMELWKREGVNPMKGCLPQLISMPVWFALYTTLQTAVELYNIPFLWFPDLSEPDPYYVLPFVIGGVFFAQQKLMPMQGGDPAQQKMMMYFMPAMFTIFMLFLPAGLGVYMFTNSLLGIGQQRVVEAHAKKHVAAKKAAGEVSSSPTGKKKNKRGS